MTAGRLRLPTIPAGGLMFFALLVAVALAAALTRSNLVYLVLAYLLATFMVSNLIGRLSLSGLELDFRVPEIVCARRKLQVSVEVRNTKRWMPSFSLRLCADRGSVFRLPLYFPRLPRGASVEQAVEVVFPRRGIHHEDYFEFRTGFPFGLIDRRAPVRLRRKILVYPSLDPRPEFEDILVGISGERASLQRGWGHDFYRIRPYEPDESARYVDWKATAHTGCLQVREFAREEDPLVELVLDLNAPVEYHPWFETAVECCAWLCWYLAQREARVYFVSQQVFLAAPAAGDVHKILQYLALVTPHPSDYLPVPVARSKLRIVFTCRPQHYSERTWDEARFVTPQTLPVAEP